MIATLEAWLAHAGIWALVAIFFVIMLESSAFIGLLFPGEMAALIAGALSASGAFSPSLAFASVAGAAIAGDLGGYALGRYRGQAVLTQWSFAHRQYERHRARIEYYFARWGSATVLAARFVAVGRAFAPFAAGLSGMRARRFIPMAVVSGLLWGGALVALGFLLGSKWRVVETWMRSLGAGIFILFAFTVAMIALWRWTAAHQDQLTAAWRRGARRYGIDLDPFVEFVRARLSPTGYLGLHFTVGLLAIGATAWLFGGVAQDIFAQDPLVHVDRTVASIVASHRTADLDAFMVVPDFLGNSWWLIFVVIASAAVSALIGDATLAATAAPILGGAYALAYGLQMLFSGFSPNVPAANLVHGFQGFPSVTLTAVTAAYGIAAYAVMAHTRTWRMQTLGVMLALYLILLVGLSALYAGRMLSTIVGGFALGGCWLAICLTGAVTYGRLRRRRT
ncbi:MAG: VTT domain-containing protein [Candidatus Binataceae bacterium]|nr:VTT domain-containing protein [Candidatus Binataceae bacterium]